MHRVVEPTVSADTWGSGIYQIHCRVRESCPHTVNIRQIRRICPSKIASLVNVCWRNIALYDINGNTGKRTREIPLNKQSNNKYYTAVMSYNFWNTNPCRTNQEWNQPKAGSQQSSPCSAHRDVFLQNLSSLSPEWAALNPGREKSSLTAVRISGLACYNDMYLLTNCVI
jgi:hypothetical protein